MLSNPLDFARLLLKSYQQKGFRRSGEFNCLYMDIAAQVDWHRGQQRGADPRELQWK